MNDMNPDGKAGEDSSTMPLKRVAFHRPILDLCFLIILGFTPLFLIKYAQPYKRGFYCSDNSIRYTYKTSTVNQPILYGIGYGVPVLLIVILESLRLFYFEQKRFGDAVTQSCHIAYGRRVHPLVARLYYFLGYFMLGAVATVFLTNCGKFSIGRLRPHFINACKPDWSKLHCEIKIKNGSETISYGDRYITEPHCTGDPKMIKAARLSFPSGHTSFSFYSMLFTAIYLQVRGAEFFDYLLTPLLQLFLMLLAILTAFSRISDYKHHVLDVIVGGVLGVFIAVCVTIFIGRFIRLPKFIARYQTVREKYVNPDVGLDTENGMTPKTTETVILQDSERPETHVAMATEDDRVFHKIPR